jgi:flagellar basal-body rod modification protein FlgD
VTISDTSATTATAQASAVGAAQTLSGAATAKKTLGQDAFLKLLVTQLEHQDPTKPVDDTQFIAQLATFSQLEKLTEIADSVKLLVQQQTPSTSSGTDAADQTSTGTQASTGA